MITETPEIFEFSLNSVREAGYIDIAKFTIIGSTLVKSSDLIKHGKRLENMSWRIMGKNLVAQTSEPEKSRGLSPSSMIIPSSVSPVQKQSNSNFQLRKKTVHETSLKSSDFNSIVSIVTKPSLGQSIRSHKKKPVLQKRASKTNSFIGSLIREAAENEKRSKSRDLDRPVYLSHSQAKTIGPKSDINIEPEPRNGNVVARNGSAYSYRNSLKHELKPSPKSFTKKDLMGVRRDATDTKKDVIYAKKDVIGTKRDVIDASNTVIDSQNAAKSNKENILNGNSIPKVPSLFGNKPQATEMSDSDEGDARNHTLKDSLHEKLAELNKPTTSLFTSNKTSTLFPGRKENTIVFSDDSSFSDDDDDDDDDFSSSSEEESASSAGKLFKKRTKKSRSKSATDEDSNEYSDEDDIDDDNAWTDDDDGTSTVANSHHNINKNKSLSFVKRDGEAQGPKIKKSLLSSLFLSEMVTKTNSRESIYSKESAFSGSSDERKMGSSKHRESLLDFNEEKDIKFPTDMPSLTRKNSNFIEMVGLKPTLKPSASQTILNTQAMTQPILLHGASTINDTVVVPEDVKNNHKSSNTTLSTLTNGTEYPTRTESNSSQVIDLKESLRRTSRSSSTSSFTSILQIPFTFFRSNSEVNELHQFQNRLKQDLVSQRSSNAPAAAKSLLNTAYPSHMFHQQLPNETVNRERKPGSDQFIKSKISKPRESDIRSIVFGEYDGKKVNGANMGQTEEDESKEFELDSYHNRGW